VSLLTELAAFFTDHRQRGELAAGVERPESQFERRWTAEARGST
jgi:hypothetical protein